MSKVVKIKPSKLTKHLFFYKKLDGYGEDGAFVRLLKGFFVKRIFFKTERGHCFLKPEYFVTRYMIIGDNPILTALSLLYAARKNIEIVYCPLVDQEKDLWGYEHLLSSYNFV